jgi:LuxR family transcriptional regulator, maltose regulon positive regulatory protein
VVQLHRAAAEWYAQHGYVIDAVRHAQAAEDWTGAAELLVDHSLTLALNGQHATLAALIARFPFDGRPRPELRCCSRIAS